MQSHSRSHTPECAHAHACTHTTSACTRTRMQAHTHNNLRRWPPPSPVAAHMMHVLPACPWAGSVPFRAQHPSSVLPPHVVQRGAPPPLPSHTLRAPPARQPHPHLDTAAKQADKSLGGSGCYPHRRRPRRRPCCGGRHRRRRPDDKCPHAGGRVHAPELRVLPQALGGLGRPCCALKPARRVLARAGRCVPIAAVRALLLLLGQRSAPRSRGVGPQAAGGGSPMVDPLVGW